MVTCCLPQLGSVVEERRNADLGNSLLHVYLLLVLEVLLVLVVALGDYWPLVQQSFLQRMRQRGLDCSELFACVGSLVSICVFDVFLQEIGLVEIFVGGQKAVFGSFVKVIIGALFVGIAFGAEAEYERVDFFQGEKEREQGVGKQCAEQQYDCDFELQVEVPVGDDVNGEASQQQKGEGQLEQGDHLHVEVMTVEVVFPVVVSHVCPLQPELQQQPDASSDGDKWHEGSQKERTDDDGYNGCVLLLDVVCWFVAYLIGGLLGEIGMLVIQEIVVPLQNFDVGRIDVPGDLTDHHVYKQRSHLDIYESVGLPQQRSVDGLENDKRTCQERAYIEQHQLVDQAALVRDVVGVYFLVAEVGDDLVAEYECGVDEDGDQKGVKVKHHVVSFSEVQLVDNAEHRHEG